MANLKVKISELPTWVPINTDYIPFISWWITKKGLKIDLKWDIWDTWPAWATGSQWPIWATWANAPEVDFEYSINGTTLWHITFAVWDKYIRSSTDWWNTWSSAMKFIWEDWVWAWDMLKSENLSWLVDYAIARTNLWLWNVDNTSDTNKPISTLTQTALDGKANSLWTDDNYVTDNEKIKLSNLSWTNSWDNATNSQYSWLAISKQDTLVSWTNIKTINWSTVLWSWDLIVWWWSWWTLKIYDNNKEIFWLTDLNIAWTWLFLTSEKIEQTAKNWSLITSAADNSWRWITYWNWLFVAVADTWTWNRVMTSPDWITWTIRTSSADNVWTSVIYWNWLFVAVAYTWTWNRVMTSPDWITWTSRTSSADNSWYWVTYWNWLFVAVATSWTWNRVMTSPDGITWTSRTSSADNAWTSVTYWNWLFVAVANTWTWNRVMTSPDWITWTSRTSSADNSWYWVTYW